MKRIQNTNRWALLFCSLILSTVVLGQGIVKNGSFEDVAAIPNLLGQHANSEGWIVPVGSSSDPDLFHVEGNMATDLPETPVAMVYPKSGKSIMGMIATGDPSTPYREYLSTQIDALEVGKKYRVSFCLTNGEITFASNAGLGVADFGIYFSQDPLAQSGHNPIVLTPSFKIDTIHFNREWQRIDFIYEPSQESKYMTFGVFESELNIRTNDFAGGGSTVAYYFLDDVSVEEYDGEPIFDEVPTVRAEIEEPAEDQQPTALIPNAFTPNQDGNNDCFHPYFTEEIKQYDLQVFNRWGELIYTSSNAQSCWDGINSNGQAFAPGVYAWTLRYVKASSQQNAFEELTGNVTLLR